MLKEVKGDSIWRGKKWGERKKKNRSAGRASVLLVRHFCDQIHFPLPSQREIKLGGTGAKKLRDPQGHHPDSLTGMKV